MPPITRLYPHDTYLYAAYPAPRPEEWLGWDRYNFTVPRLSEMALSVRYRPEWEVWIKVQPEAGNHALAWARAAQKRGYHAVYPLAYDPDPDIRQQQGLILCAALRGYQRWWQPDSAEAKRAEMIRRYPDIHRRKWEIERMTLEDLPSFPGTLPDVGTERKIPNDAQQQFAARAKAWRENRAAHRTGTERIGGKPPSLRPRFPGGSPAPAGTLL